MRQLIWTIIYLFIYFHVMFKKSQMSFIGVVPEPKSQMAQA